MLLSSGQEPDSLQVPSPRRWGPVVVGVHPLGQVPRTLLSSSSRHHLRLQRSQEELLWLDTPVDLYDDNGHPLCARESLSSVRQWTFLCRKLQNGHTEKMVQTMSAFRRGQCLWTCTGSSP
jgi:hypothetical protein